MSSKLTLFIALILALSTITAAEAPLLESNTALRSLGNDSDCDDTDPDVHPECRQPCKENEDPHPDRCWRPCEPGEDPHEGRCAPRCDPETGEHCNARCVSVTARDPEGDAAVNAKETHCRVDSAPEDTEHAAAGNGTLSLSFTTLEMAHAVGGGGSGGSVLLASERVGGAGGGGRIALLSDDGDVAPSASSSHAVEDVEFVVERVERAAVDADAGGGGSGGSVLIATASADVSGSVHDDEEGSRVGVCVVAAGERRCEGRHVPRLLP